MFNKNYFYPHLTHHLVHQILVLLFEAEIYYHMTATAGVQKRGILGIKYIGQIVFRQTVWAWETLIICPIVRLLCATIYANVYTVMCPTVQWLDSAVSCSPMSQNVAHFIGQFWIQNLFISAVSNILHPWETVKVKVNVKP